MKTGKKVYATISIKVVMVVFFVLFTSCIFDSNDKDILRAEINIVDWEQSIDDVDFKLRNTCNIHGEIKNTGNVKIHLAEITFLLDIWDGDMNDDKHMTILRTVTVGFVGGVEPDETKRFDTSFVISVGEPFLIALSVEIVDWEL